VDADVQPREGHGACQAEYERREARHRDNEGHSGSKARRGVAGRERRRGRCRHEHVNVTERFHRAWPADHVLDAGRREIGGGDGKEDGESQPRTP